MHLHARPSSWLPLLLSGVVIVGIVGHLSRFGLAHQADEGTAAHLFQILMPLQLPLIGYFAFRWISVDAHWTAKVLSIQIGLFLAIVASVFFFLDR